MITTTFRAEVANCDETDRAILATTVAVLSDPHMATERRLFRDGLIGLRVQDGEVSLFLIDPNRIGKEGK